MQTTLAGGGSKIVQPYDATDLLKKVFKPHQKNTEDSIQGNIKKVFVTAIPVVGYTLQTGVAAAITGSVAFYTDTATKQKISSLLSSVTYTQYKQVLFPLAVNIWTKHNNFNLSLDYRFLKYPFTNYGLGSHTSDDDAYTINFNYIKLHQVVLKKIYNNLYLGAGFYYDRFWNIEEVDPPPGIVTSFQKYGKSDKETAAGIALKLLYDSRQNQINPAGGAYASVTYRPNYTFLGSDNNWKSLQIDVRKYFKIFGSTKNTLALWSFDWLTLGKDKPPYLLLPSTGWDDFYNTARGYVQSRFRARDMIYAEAEYRFQISTNGFLGGVVFANAQSFSRIITKQLAVISPAAGLGLRIKLNKYSKTNLCIDYGFGLNGSKGLFLNLGEVF